MTEIYHGPWSPVSGDTPKAVVPVPDVYHRYPASSQAKAETDGRVAQTAQTAVQSE